MFLQSAYITSILALPLASTRRTAVSAVDSVAILVGVSTGELLVFTASGVLVFCERVAHDVAVTQLRLGGSVSGQRVVAVAANRAAFLDGASLHSILKTTRAEVSRRVLPSDRQRVNSGGSWRTIGCNHRLRAHDRRKCRRTCRRFGSKSTS